MKYKLWFLLSTILVIACTEAPARRPVNRIKIKEKDYSVVINKNLNTIEDKIISAYIKNDTLFHYKNSKAGFYYAKVTPSDAYDLDLEEGDTVIFEREVLDLNNHVIYPKGYFGKEIYIVGKMPLIQGLQEGLKIMKENEEFRFIFPSFAAYGFSGDEQRIGSNKILIMNVKLLKIKK